MINLIIVLIKFIRGRRRKVLLHRGEGHVILKIEIGVMLLGDEKEAKSQGIQGATRS